MNLYQELRSRRVLQITGGYIAGGWAIVQFLTFLEGRMTVSPHLVNLVGLFLLLLLPTVVTMAWVHGRPGRDSWGRIPKVVLPANLLAIALLLLFLFYGRDFGAIIQTIKVEDENGAVSERVIPKNEFRRKVLMFYPRNTGEAANDWARETVAFLELMDISQDDFVDVMLPLNLTNAMVDAGSDDGHGLNRARQRKIAQDAHFPYFTTGTINRQGDRWILTTDLHESESGRDLATRSHEAADLFALADLASRQLREDLGIPSAQLANSQDLGVSELTSSNLEAVQNFVSGLLAMTHKNDWEGAMPLIERAIELDPCFSIAQFLAYENYLTLGQTEKGSAAIAAAVENLYQLPERSRFMIKAQYYYSEKHDADKTMAILQMWSQIYPNDVSAYRQQALHYFVRQDLPNTIAAYEKILMIDPSQVQYLTEIAGLYIQLGQHKEAERYLQRYVEFYPTRADGYEDLASFYSEIGRLDEARLSLERAQLLDPESLDITLALIDLNIKLGRYQESIPVLEAELTKTRNARERTKVLARQVNLASLMGQTDRLIETLEASYQARLEYQNPLQVNIIYSIMLPAISMAGRPEEAILKLDELASQITPPYDKLTCIGKAWALANLGRTEEATAALTEAREVVDTFKFETMRPTITLVNGMIDEAAGDLDAAAKHYRNALETALQANPMMQVRLARVLRLQDHLDQAQEVLAEALIIEPAHPEAHLEMAFLLNTKGDYEQARSHLMTAQAAWTEAHSDFLPAQQARELETKI